VSRTRREAAHRNRAFDKFARRVTREIWTYRVGPSGRDATGNVCQWVRYYPARGPFAPGRVLVQGSPYGPFVHPSWVYPGPAPRKGRRR
jgi:hypothetical protein